MVPPLEDLVAFLEVGLEEPDSDWEHLDFLFSVGTPDVGDAEHDHLRIREDQRDDAVVSLEQGPALVLGLDLPQLLGLLSEVHKPKANGHLGGQTEAIFGIVFRPKLRSLPHDLDPISQPEVSATSIVVQPRIERQLVRVSVCLQFNTFIKEMPQVVAVIVVQLATIEFHPENHIVESP